MPIFNKNHYNLICDVLTRARRDDAGERRSDDDQALIDAIAFDFAERLQGTNDQYSPRRFLFACNVRKNVVRERYPFDPNDTDDTETSP